MDICFFSIFFKSFEFAQGIAFKYSEAICGFPKLSNAGFCLSFDNLDRAQKIQLDSMGRYDRVDNFFTVLPKGR